MNKITILTAALVCMMAAGCAYGKDRTKMPDGYTLMCAPDKTYYTIKDNDGYVFDDKYSTEKETIDRAWSWIDYRRERELTDTEKATLVECVEKIDENIMQLLTNTAVLEYDQMVFVVTNYFIPTICGPITTATVTNEVPLWQMRTRHNSDGTSCLVMGCKQEWNEWKDCTEEPNLNQQTNPYGWILQPSIIEKRKKPDYRREIVSTITTANLEYNGRTITVELDNVVVRTNNYNRVKVADAVYEWRGE